MRSTPALHVARPRLLAGLQGAAPLVLVSGPAGSGKTTLLDAWCAGLDDPAPVCRVALEDDETLLWQPVLRSLGAHGLAVPALERRLGADPLLGEELLSDLADAVVGSGQRWTVAVDGYELTDLRLAEELDTLLRRTRGALRWVLATRVDPVLPLYRYRLEESVSEVRAADLAFTDAEAAALLAGFGAKLSPEGVRELNAALGGWVTGLSFAARALADHPEPENVVAALGVRDVDITEYLLHEVLDVQPPETRDLLLRASVPDVLEPELVEDLFGPGGTRRLAALTGANLFLEPADVGGGLHYPTFVRDLLRAQFAHEDPSTSVELHLAVARWLREREQWERASAQLASGGLWEDLAHQLVDDLLVARILVGQDTRLSAFARRIPAEVRSPAAYVVRATLALANADAADCAEQLRRARAAAGQDAADDSPTSLAHALVAAAQAPAAGDLAGADVVVSTASRALATARRPAARLASPELEGLLQVAAARVALRHGELGRARAGLARAEALPGLPAHFRSAVLGFRSLTDALDGRLSQASRRAERALALAEDTRTPPDGQIPAAHVALALVALERDDLASVRRHLGEARVCRRLVNDPVSRAVAAGTLAHLEARTGAGLPPLPGTEALDAWDDVRDPWLVGWLRLQAAEIAVALGRPEDALVALDTLARGEGPSGEVVAAAAYAEQGRSVALGRTLAHAAVDPSPVSQVNRLLVEAVRTADRHSVRAAAPLVEQALELAAREGVRRPFRAASPSVRRLLAGNRELLEHHQWLRGSPVEPARVPVRNGVPRARGSVTTRSVPRGSGAPLESLTPKELEVLGHLEELLTTQEIAEKMFVSVNTVRTHVRSILRKLGVNRRNSAVRRARSLGLLDGPLASAGPITPEG